jgi:hypothetical protein
VVEPTCPRLGFACNRTHLRHLCVSHILRQLLMQLRLWRLCLLLPRGRDAEAADCDTPRRLMVLLWLLPSHLLWHRLRWRW